MNGEDEKFIDRFSRKRPLGTPRRMQRDNIKIDVKNKMRDFRKDSTL